LKKKKDTGLNREASNYVGGRESSLAAERIGHH